MLGLEDDEAAEYAAPFGLVRSLAMQDDSRTVRLRLSVPVLRRGDWAPGVADPQHVTLRTEDLERTANALMAAGLPLLGNYYDDLAARLDLATELFERLQRLGAMYDEDHAGSYLQLFTPIIGGRIFFELVQRLGDYQGYGITNEPVRMAAHRAYRRAQA